MRSLKRAAVGALAALGALVAAVTLIPDITFGWATALAGPWTDAPGDIIVVLGAGGLGANDVLADSSYWRAAYAVRVWREDPRRRLVVSGAGVAQPMRDYLIGHGVPAEAITLEQGSQSTRENALLVKPILDGLAGRAILLTSDFHMWRAWRTFRAVGIDAAPRPFPDVRKRAGGWRGRWPAFLDLAQETVKIGYYWSKGWLG